MKPNLIIGILSVVIVIWFSLYIVALLWFKRAEGRIVRYEEENDSDNGTIMRGIIEYEDHNGNRKELRRWIAFSENMGIRLSSKTTVLYHPTFTGFALEWSASALLGIPIIVFVVIIVLMSSSNYMAYLS